MDSTSSRTTDGTDAFRGGVGLAAELAASGLSPEAVAEIGEYAERLERKGRAIEAARLSFEQRVREFVDKYGRGPKAGRHDYTSIIRCDEFEPMRIALDVYDGARKSPLPPKEAEPR